MTAGNILIIDDERYVLRMFRSILERVNYRVTTADDGDLGLRLFSEDRPDLVVLDIAMPGMDGVEVLERIRRWDPQAEVPVVVISAHAQSSFKEIAEKLGADAFLEKPITSQELIVAIASSLGQEMPQP